MQRGRPGVPLPGHWSLPDAVRGEWQILAPCGHVWGGGPARPGQSGSSLLMFHNPHCPGPHHRARHHAPHPVAAALQLHPRHGPQPRAQDDRRHQVRGVR